MGAKTLAVRAGHITYEAAEILARLRARFRVFEEYAQRVLDRAGIELEVSTPFGWVMQTPPGTKHRTIRNFPMQSAGSEVLHIASIMAERRGLEVVAPVHDAIMAEAVNRGCRRCIHSTRSHDARSRRSCAAGIRITDRRSNRSTWAALPRRSRRSDVEHGHEVGGQVGTKGILQVKSNAVQFPTGDPFDDPAWNKVSKKVPRSRARKFTMFPGAWEERLTKARHLATYRVALHILYRAWRHKGEPILLANEQLADKGVTRRNKWRALAELEQLGLITVVKRQRKSPIITVLEVE